MTSTSAEDTVVRGLCGDAISAPGTHGELRSGLWTRLGSHNVLGDAVTEQTLESLAQRTRLAAKAQGYAVGWAEGRQAAQARAEEEAREARLRREQELRRASAEQADATAALLRAAARLEESFSSACTRVEERAVELALILTEAILDREAAAASDPGAEALRRALALVPAGCSATVRLHPTDLAGLDRSALPADTVTLVGDPTLARGDAVAETDTLVVDAAISTAMARVREALTRGDVR
ncbi:MAG TPA: FliH/SctL family protein [Nocardioidaceae bacterium]|nr:FliH/SctL family protein [Nocardioidaceae bacterium]